VQNKRSLRLHSLVI